MASIVSAVTVGLKAKVGGDGEGEGVCDDGAGAVSGESACHGDGENFDDETVRFMNAHSHRLQSLQEALTIFTGIGGALGASLSTNVKQVIHNEEKRFRARIGGNAAVDKAMRAIADEEEHRAQLRRLEFQESCQLKREQSAAREELSKAKAKLTAMRKANREAEDVAAVVTAVKSFSLPMLGEGQKNSGGAAFKKARRDLMNRIRGIAMLSDSQKNDWQHFQSTWDQKMAEAHGAGWAEKFAQIMQHVLNGVEGGEPNALSDFMHKETLRVLGDVPVVSVRGVARH